VNFHARRDILRSWGGSLTPTSMRLARITRRRDCRCLAGAQALPSDSPKVRILPSTLRFPVGPPFRRQEVPVLAGSPQAGTDAFRWMRRRRVRRERFATAPIVSARDSFRGEQRWEGSTTASGRRNRPPPLLQPWRTDRPGPGFSLRTTSAPPTSISSTAASSYLPGSSISTMLARRPLASARMSCRDGDPGGRSPRHRLRLVPVTIRFSLRPLEMPARGRLAVNGLFSQPCLPW
jgi:hypothetical protein